MVKYTCELCLKDFTQKVDYTRHKNKKNACVSIQQLEKLQEKNAYDNSEQQRLTTLFASCMNILRDSEHLTGDKALRNLSYLLVIRFIEPMIGKGKEIDLDSYEYNLEGIEYQREELLHYTRFSNIASSMPENIPSILSGIWERILSQYSKTKDIFLPNKDFDIKKQSTFVKLVKKLEEFDFNNLSVDIQGHAYEDLLKDIMTGKVLGQYFTQPLVKDLMVELVNPKLYEDGTCETIFDPAMGTGGFLMSSLVHMKKQARIEDINIDWTFMTSKGLGGREAESDTFQMAKTNMLVSSGHMFTGLEQGDSIREPITNKYDIVLANPPFGIKGLKYTEIDSKYRNEYIPIETHSAVPLFLQAIISILKIGGRCCMVMPDGQELFGKSKVLVSLREYLVKTCDLKEIYFMPSGVFSNTSIKTCVVYFHKKKEGTEIVDKKVRTYKFSNIHQTKKVKFYDYNPYEKVKNLLVEVDIDILAENGYSLNHTEYMEEEEETYNECVEWRNLGEVLVKNKQKIKLEDDEEYNVIGMSSHGYSHIKKIVQGEEIKMKTQQPTVGGQFVLSKILSYSYGFITSETSEGILSNEFWIFDIDNNLILSKYFGYVYNKYICPKLEKISTGVGIPRINYEKFCSIRIPVPSLQVQEQIVDKLDFLNEQNTDIKQLIESLKQKQTMLIETLTMGENIMELGEVCEINQGKILNKKSMVNGNIKVIGGGKIIGYHNEFNRKVDSTILTRVGDININYMKAPFYLTDNGFSLYTDNEYINKYIYYYLLNNKNILSGFYNGTAQKVISKTNLKNIRIPVPSLEVQEQIIEGCERVDNLITNLKQDLEENTNMSKLILEKTIQNCSEGDGIIFVDDSDEEEIVYED